MRKWTYLVAMLMLACATTTFTGCIDTDEPAGIEQLRGAKAKLLEAKAVVEAAKVKQVEAEAALKNAEAKAKEAEAQAIILRAEYEKAIAEQMAAAEIERIAAEIAKLQAETDAKIAEAESLRQSAAAAELEALMNLEILKAQLEGAKQDNIEKLVSTYKSYTKDYDTAYKAYLAAVKAYNEALTDLETETSDEFATRTKLEGDVEKAKKNLAEAEEKIQLYTDSLEIAKNMTVDELYAKQEAYETEKKAYDDSIAYNQLAWDLMAVEKKAEFDKYYALLDSVTAASTFTIPAYKNETAKGNDALKKAFGYDVLEYVENTKAKLEYTKEGELKPIAEMASIETWLELLEKAKRDDNGLILDSLNDKYPYDKEIALADSTFKADSLAWSIMVAAMNGEKTEPTALITEYMKAVDAYNAKFAQVEGTVKLQNDAAKAVYNAEEEVAGAAYDEELTALTDSVKAVLYVQIFDKKYDSKILGKYQAAWNATNADDKDKEVLDFYLTSLDSTKVQAFLADSVTKAWAKDWAATSDDYKELIKAAEETKSEAIEADIKKDKTSKIKTAYLAYVAAADSVTKLETALANLLSQHGTALDTYKTSLKSEYAQVLSGADTLNHTGLKLNADAIDCIKNKAATADSTYTVEDATKKALKLADGTLHYVGIKATSTNISAAEIADLKKTELMEYADIKVEWKKKSDKVWGTLAEGRMLPLTEDDITEMKITDGKLYALMQAKAKKQEATEKSELNGVIDALIAEIEAQKVVLQGIINAAIANVAEEQAAVDAQQAVIDALNQPFKDKLTALNEAKSKADKLFAAYTGIITQLGDDKLVSKEDIKEAVEDAQAKLTDALKADLDALKNAITKAEMALLENADTDALLVAAKKYEMDLAEYTMNQAKKFMEMAEEYLKNYLASLADTETAE